MAMLNHNIFDNIRTRVVVHSQGHIIMLPPLAGEDGWLLPGGGLERDETLAECARREVLEETGIEIEVAGIIFLREWVLPMYAALEAAKLIRPTHGATPVHDHGYCLEVYLYATTPTSMPVMRGEHTGDKAPEWVPLADVEGLPLWPKHLRWLCRRLAAGIEPAIVRSFLNEIESPWTTLAEDPFVG